MARECRFGKMGPGMRAIGVIIRHMARAHFGTFMVISMRGSGETIRLMALVLTLTRMEPSIQGIGKMIFRMDMEKSNG